MKETCFHCGLEVPPELNLTVRYKNLDRPVCCLGCRAVAQGIIDAGLERYYEQRTAVAGKTELPPPEVLERIKLYDAPEIGSDFVENVGEHENEVLLMLSGITCAACVWLIEQRLAALPGIIRADVNYSTLRARVAWNPELLSLSEILLAVRNIGYEACPYTTDRAEEAAQKERKQALLRLWVAGLSMMQVMMYAVPTYLFGDIEEEFLWLLHWASMVLTLPVVLFSALPFYRGMIRDIKNRRAGMDTPVALAILLSFAAGCVALVRRQAEGVFFDSISMFVFLLLGGRFLEQTARRRAADAAERLVKLIPAFCHKITDISSKQCREAAVARLNVGDLILVKAGEAIPADGVVVEGESEVNEAMLTGESLPLPKKPDDRVTAGTVNINGPLVIRVEGVGRATRLGSIVRLLDAAMAQKPRTAQLADRAAAIFVGALLLLAATVFVAWSFIADPNRALWITVSLLVITCPCALSLATPTALTAAMSAMTRGGMLVADGGALERLANIDEAVFDKTGTVTEGRLRLEQTLLFGATDLPGSLNIARALEAGSEHPIAQALAAAPEETVALAVSEVRNTVGQGIEGTVAGEAWRIGRVSFVAALAGDPPRDLPAGTVVALGSAQGFAAVFVLRDRIKTGVRELVSRLKARGIRTRLLSGDTVSCVREVARELGFDDFRAEASPEEKLACVTEMQSAGRKVLMIGDGVNDAPVLARADVSVAMASGADVSRQGSDMVMINDRPGVIADAVAVAVRTRRIIRENLCWAGAYNAVAVPVAALGYAKPAVAALGMALSSLLVVGNALRLLRLPNESK